MTQITFDAELGIDGQPIIIARCGDASALYDVRTREYVAEDTDACPITDDECWPEPPAAMIAAENWTDESTEEKGQ